MGNKEIRDILLRRMVRVDEQFWVAAPPEMKFHFQGVRDGAGDVRLFGVTHKTRGYQLAEAEPAAALDAAERALYSMGRPIRLASVPGAKACFYAPNWIAPVVLTVEAGENGLQMTAYTGRSLVAAPFRCHISLWILKRRLPEGVVGDGKSRKVSRAEMKLAKKEAKLAKKGAKQTQKEAKAAQKGEKPAQKETKPVLQEAKSAEPKKQAGAQRAGKRLTPAKKKAAPKRLKK